MESRQKIKYIHEGQFVAEIKVELIEPADGWSPYLNLEDSYRLDDVRTALRAGDLESAAKYGRIYELRPVVGAK